MKEYIERAAARNAVKRVIGDQDHICKAMMDFYVALNEVPVAEVVEVRHGRWIDLNAENSTGPLFKCSECSHLHNPNRDDLDLERVELNPLYCDACGTRMDKEDEHEAD